MAIQGILLLSYAFWPLLIGIYLAIFLLGTSFTLYYGYKVMIFTFTSILILIQTFRNSVLEPATFAISSNIRKSFPIHIPENLPKKAIYAWHPHGLYAISPFIHCCSSMSDLNIPMSLAAHSVISSIPLINLLPIRNKLIPVNEEVMKYELFKNISVSVVPGGVKESYNITQKKLHLVLKDRKGIFRIAIDTQTPLVPVLVFGENNLFEPINSDWNKHLQKFIESCISIQFPIPSWNSLKHWFTLLRKPFEIPVKTCIGDPVYPLPDDTIESLRDRYIDALNNLYDTHRPADWEELIEYS